MANLDEWPLCNLKVPLEAPLANLLNAKQNLHFECSHVLFFYRYKDHNL